MPDEAVFVRSDHYPMVRAGIPSIMLSPGMANGGGAAFSLFLGTHYHKVTDDVTLPINWPAAARFARLNEAVLRQLADADDASTLVRRRLLRRGVRARPPKVPRPTIQRRVP